MNPPLRFSTSEDWTECQLKDICEINPSVEKIPDTFQYIDLESVTNGRLLQTIPCCKSSAPSRAKRILSNEDVLFQTVRPYQKNNYFFKSDSNTSVVASTGYAQLRCTSNSAYFLYTLIHTDSFVNQVLQKCTGGAYPAITASSLSTVKINIPVVQEQQKIASFFSTLDQKIELNERKIEALEKLKKGVMQKIFTQEIRFKDKNGNQFPNWFSKKLLYVAPLQRGFDLPNSNLVPGSFPVVYSNGINFSHNSYKCEGEAVITGRSGTIGRVTYLPNCKYWPHNTTLWVTNFFNNIPKFIYYLYQYIDLNRFSTGTGVPTLNRNIIHDFVVTIPIRDEQLKISQFLTTIDTKINTAKLCLERLQELKKGFMQQMFV